jgi:hypothetical protein
MDERQSKTELQCVCGRGGGIAFFSKVRGCWWLWWLLVTRHQSTGNAVGENQFITY